VTRSFLTLVLALVPAPLLAQGVLVAPHAIILDHRTRSGSLSLYNPGPEPAEISLSTFYGYPVTDSTGEFQLQTVESPDSTAPSAAGWIEAFPKRMVLAPKERQTVRLLARPPAGLADGEYWARLVVSAKGGTVPVRGVADSSGVSVGLSLEVRTVLPLQYRKGRVSTSVRLAELSVRVEGDSLALRPHLTRIGNGAYLGTLRAVIRDSAGHVVASLASPLAVYYDMAPRLTAPLPAAGLPPGSYQVEVEAAAEREDIAPELLLKSPPERFSLAVRLP
jgi:P pilus assembly chaperone PapD